MPDAVLTEAIERVASGQDLTADEAARVLHEIMAGNASEAQTAGFLIALRTKGETVAEIAGLARATRQVIGVSERPYLETLAAALRELGTENALVVSSADGLDEFSASGATRVVELKAGKLESYEVTPEQVGLEPAPPTAADWNGTPERNA